jgi:hypothetical protein
MTKDYTNTMPNDTHDLTPAAPLSIRGVPTWALDAIMRRGARTGLSVSAQARIILCAAATRYMAAEKRENEGK